MLHNTQFNREIMEKIGFPQEAQVCFTKMFQLLDENKEWGDEFDKIYEDYMFPWANELGQKLDRVTELAKKMNKKVTVNNEVSSKASLPITIISECNLIFLIYGF